MKMIRGMERVSFDGQMGENTEAVTSMINGMEKATSRGRMAIATLDSTETATGMASASLSGVTAGAMRAIGRMAGITATVRTYIETGVNTKASGGTISGMAEASSLGPMVTPMMVFGYSLYTLHTLYILHSTVYTLYTLQYVFFILCSYR
jgi:hypothetical protein